MTDAAIYSFDTALTTNRGYTGHEQLDNVGLVHMNGRVYDPTLGRFLSADPHVQAPGNLQNWNRYSYVLNNPLSYTDPTGFFFSKLFKALGAAFGKLFSAIGSAFKKLLNSGILRSIIQTIGCSPVAVAATFGISCAAAVFGTTLAAGGSIQDALKATAFAFASMGSFYAVGQIFANAAAVVQMAAHGVVSGALSVVRGGNFVAGFVAGAVGKLGSIATRGIQGLALRTAVAGAFGCAGAVVAGGKCASAAVTAAFAHMYNEFFTGGKRHVNPFDVGNDAHKALQDAVSGGDVHAEVYGDDEGSKFDGRVDLANFLSKEVWEIKPDHGPGMLAGWLQVRHYAHYSGYKLGLTSIFGGSSFFMASGAYGIYTYRLASSGVIAYELSDPLDTVVRHYNWTTYGAAKAAHNVTTNLMAPAPSWVPMGPGINWSLPWRRPLSIP